MKPPSILILSSFLLFACKSNKIQTADPKANTVANQAVHNFSNPEKADTFKVQIVGDSLLSGKVHLTIIDYTGNTIYKDEFAAACLIPEALKSKPLAEKEAHIRTCIANFFIEKNFKKPAIGATEKFDDMYSDKESWEDIKSDATAISFFYSPREGDERFIAYSKKMKYVLMIFSCCQ